MTKLVRRYKEEVVAFRITAEDAEALDKFVGQAAGRRGNRSRALRILVSHALKCKTLRDEVKAKGLPR